MADAIAGVGATFLRWDGNDWISVAEIRAIVGPSTSKDMLNVTSLTTLDGYNEFTSGFANGGTVSLAMSFTRDGYELFKEDFELSSSVYYGIQLADEYETFIGFNGLVIELPITTPADDKVDVNIKIQITGVLDHELPSDWPSAPVESSSVELDEFIDYMAFWGGTFDFENNLWLDQSGNGNHVSLKGASARTGNGSNLDYTITGLLTSDTIEVVSGSDTPTIPVNGTLRIGGSQIVYGVTIKRSGAIWAIIPFCEPIVTTNLPTRSFDVSGNNHHASCASLIAENVTTQDTYFYLQQYGYNLGSENILNWNLTSWSGDVETYTAIFAGVTLGDTQSENAYLQPTPDGLGCRYTRNASYNMRLRQFSTLTSGRTYRFKIRLANYSSSGLSGGFQIGNLGINTTNRNWLISDGVFDLQRAATSTTFEMGASNTLVSTIVDFYDPELRLFEIVPALLIGTNDALGRVLEFVPDGNTFLRYGGQLQLPVGLIAADQKGCWSDYINQGYCVNGKTYLIEKTQINHFGIGLASYDEFVSNGTEWCDDNNVVRELILNSGERGFFFDDDTTPHPRSYTDFSSIKTHFCYCEKRKIEEYHMYNPTTPGLYPQYFSDTTGYGWKGYIESNKIKNLIIFKEDTYIADSDKVDFNALFYPYEEISFAMVAIVFDSMEADELTSIIGAFDARKFKLTRAIYYSDTITKNNNDTLLKDTGHEVIVHTPAFGVVLPEWKAFHDTAENYTEEELEAYYTAVRQFIDSNGYKAHKILPGGGYDMITQMVAPNHFYTTWRAMGSDDVNMLPLVTPNCLGRSGNDFVDSASIEEAEGVVDDLITKRGWTIFYSHNYAWSGESLANMGELLDYIAAKTASGEAIRFMKMDDAYKIIKKIM